MKAINNTPAGVHSVGIELTEKEGEALVKARRDLRKATIAQDGFSDYEVDVINGLVMFIGSLVEEGRDSRTEDFDGRSY